MSEQPKPVEDEVERALASMRAGFLSGSYHIAAGITSLEEYLAAAPFDQTEPVRAAVAKIIATQERLKARVDLLPESPWERFKAMVSLVKAQQAVLDELGLLVQKHVLPRQLENLTVTPFQGALPPHEPAPPPAYEPAPPPLPFEDPPPPPPRAARRPPRVTRAARADDYDDDDDEERRSLLARLRERATGIGGLVAMVVVGVILSQYPRDIRLQDMTARLAEMAGSWSTSAPSDDPVARPSAEPAPARPSMVAAPAPAERIPPASDASAARGRVAPAPTAPSEQRRAVAPAPSPPAVVAAVPDRAEPPTQSSEARSSEPAAGDKPPTTSARVAEERFVPVVFTHKDYATVMQAMTDLKQQYPNLLVGRKGEVQPVDLGKKGVWHRLVFLPAGPRSQATKLCDQLAAEGYDRCWVKAY
jgi:hypothetical protein